MRTWFVLPAALMCLLLFAGCHASDPGMTEGATITSLPPATAETEDSRLADFARRLSDQGVASLEEFQANYEEARGLYQDGIRPEKAMPSYAPAQGQSAPGDFYCALVNPDVYGITKFFVLPAGERGMSAEEYLELVECAGSMAAQDLVRPENAWLSTQTGREDPKASRLAYRSESFWMPYLLGMHDAGQELPAEEESCEAVYLPLPVEDAEFILYPAGHLYPRGLLAVGLHLLDRAPESRRAKYTPPENTDHEALRQEALKGLSEHVGVEEEPAAVYYGFTDTTSPGAETRSCSWTVGVLLPGGASYTVRLDGEKRELVSIQKLPDGAMDLNGDWSALDEAPIDEVGVFHQ